MFRLSLSNTEIIFQSTSIEIVGEQIKKKKWIVEQQKNQWRAKYYNKIWNDTWKVKFSSTTQMH